MKIYSAEVEDGLEHKLESSASITYACLAEPCDKNISKNMRGMKSLASLSDSDLYYVQSILVSSNWNKNDDIFDKAEVWVARNTPEDKPTNLEHDESVIIGHITSNWPITQDGILIDENTPIENLPEKYHILTGSVIYKAFTNPELKDRAEKLIAEIENGTKYVSMECFFGGFDYGIQNKITGEYKVLARNAETAYLTKHLRAYGGMGEHGDYKIGRVLRHITFSGKGFVDKPANPESVIFTKDSVSHNSVKNSTEKNANLSIAGVSNNQFNPNAENNTMNLEQDVTELKQKIEAMSDCSEAVKEAYALSSELKDKVAQLETELSSRDTTIAELQTAQEALAAEKEEAAKKKSEEDMAKDEEVKKVKAELAEALETIAAYKAKEEEMAKKEKKMKRVASLVDAGLDTETATSAVDQFESMDDETFASIAVLLAAKSKMAKKDAEETEEEMSKDSKSESKASDQPEEDVEEPQTENPSKAATVDASVLDTAEVTEEVNLGIGGDAESSIESTRAALVEFVSSRLGKKL